MKILRNHLIGVDQGGEILFSDFEDGGAMWTGQGTREVRKKIDFSRPYKSIPAVSIHVDMFDFGQNANQRSDITAENVTHTGFEAVFKTWDDTRVARIRVAWTAIGEIKGDDEWELY